MSGIVTIYILDKSPFWFAKKMNNITEASRFEVKTFTTTESLKNIIEDANNPEGNVIINLGHFGVSGIELIQHFVSNYPGLKIVGIFENDKFQKKLGIGVEELIKLGVSDIFIKPIEIKNLTKALNGRQGISELISKSPNTQLKLQVEGEDERFYSVPLNSFIADKEVQFDTFIKLKDGHYVKVLKKGDAFEQSFLEKYSTKGISDLYMSNDDRLDYIRYCNKMSTRMAQYIGLEDEKRYQNQSQAIEKYLQEVYTQGVTSDILAIGKEMSSNVTEMVESDKSFKNIMDTLEGLGPAQLEHSFLVSFLASMIAIKFDWNSDVITDTLNLACIFHDVGKSKLPKELREKNPISMKKEELEEYEQHPIYGAELLSEHKNINPTVVQIIIQHHENCDGSGFPHGLQAKKLLNLSKVVRLCDSLAHLMKEKQISAPDAFMLLMKDPMAPSIYSYDVIEKFCDICEQDMAPHFKKVS